jgi:hypothetical protein
MEAAMKKTVLTVGIIITLVVTSWRLATTQTQVADFKIVIEATTGGAKLECLRGCAWNTLSFGCDGKAECKAQVDQTGVSGIKTP